MDVVEYFEDFFNRTFCTGVQNVNGHCVQKVVLVGIQTMDIVRGNANHLSNIM